MKHGTSIHLGIGGGSVGTLVVGLSGGLVTGGSVLIGSVGLNVVPV